jgi:hypothetical protein
MPKKKTKRLGVILLDEGLITSELLEQGLRRRGQSAKRLGSTLVKPGLLEPAVLARVLARQAGVPGCDLFAVRIPDEALAKSPRTGLCTTARI